MSYYVTHENSVLNINNAHLKVSGNVQTDVMKLGAIEFAPPESDVPGTVNFTNVTTGVTTTSNLNVGGTLMLGSVELVTATNALEQTVNLGNTTSNTVQFTNPTTGLVATGNVETQGKFIGDGSALTGISTTLQAITDSGNVTSNTIQFSNAITGFVTTANIEVGTANLFVDTASSKIGVGTVRPSKTLVVGGDVAFPQSVTSTDSHNTIDRALYIGGKDYNGSLTQAKCAIVSSPLTTNGGAQQYGRNSLHFCVGPDSQDDVNASVTNSRLSVSHTGNVGIGVLNPQARLHINNDLYLQPNSDSWNTTVGKGLFMRYSTMPGQDQAYIQSIDRSNTLLSYPLYFQASVYNFGVGDVVINDGTLQKPGNPGCRVSKNVASFTLGLHSTYPISYDYELHDTGNDYNTSTYKFTCPVAGKYLCIHMMTTRSTRARVAISEVKLYHNSSETARQFQDITQDSSCATTVIDCAAGDTLYAGIYNASASNEFNGWSGEYGSQFIVEFLG